MEVLLTGTCNHAAEFGAPISGSVSTYPTVLAEAALAGLDASGEQDSQFAQWSKVLARPQVKGMVVGRSLLSARSKRSGSRRRDC
jgi:hypothetical protein